MQLTPQDKDLVVRTIIGEAAGQPAEGQAAVAYSIFNRLNRGGYGKTVRDVVFKPSAYEPWSTRGNELLSIPMNSKAYQSAAAIVDGIASGEIEDPTGGKTHFLNERIVKQRRGGTLPDWAQGAGQRIGAHTFFDPDNTDKPAALAFSGDDRRSAIPDFLGQYVKGDGVKSKQERAEAAPDFLSAYAKPSAAQPPQNAAQLPDGSRPPKAPSMMTPAEKQAEAEGLARGKEDANRSVFDKAASGVATVGKDYLGRLRELLGQNAGLVAEGLSDITQNRPATGALKTGLGALGYVFSPAGAIDTPIAKATGNKEFGEKAAMLIPGAPLWKAANAARPTVSAVKDLIKDIGPENIPQVVKRLESNPNLTLMDVAPAVRGNAAGLATDPRNVPAMNQLTEFQKGRMAERPKAATDAFEDVLGPTPNAKETVDAIKEQARKTGKELIEPSIASIKEVNVAPIIKKIDDQIPPSMLADLKAGREPPAMPDETKRLWGLREKLRGDAKDGDVILAVPEKVHNLQSELRLASGDPQIGFHARSVRHDLVNAMDEASGKPAVLDKDGNVVTPAQKPTYKAALKSYADDKAVDEAFRHGFDLFSNPTSAEKSLANHPDMWKAWAADASKAELEAAKKGAMLGARSRIMNMRKGVDIPEGSFTHERLAAIVGDKEADKIVRTLNDWRDISDTDNLLLKNSATAVRQAGQEARAVRDTKTNASRLLPPVIAGAAGHFASGGASLGGLPLGPIAGTTALLGLLGMQKGAKVAMKMHDVAENRAYATWASATGPQRDELLDILREASRKSNPVSKSQKLIDLVPPSLLEAMPR